MDNREPPLQHPSRGQGRLKKAAMAPELTMPNHPADPLPHFLGGKCLMEGRIQGLTPCSLAVSIGP